MITYVDGYIICTVYYTTVILSDDKIYILYILIAQSYFNINRILDLKNIINDK